MQRCGCVTSAARVKHTPRVSTPASSANLLCFGGGGRERSAMRHRELRISPRVPSPSASHFSTRRIRSCSSKRRGKYICHSTWDARVCARCGASEQERVTSLLGHWCTDHRTRDHRAHLPTWQPLRSSPLYIDIRTYAYVHIHTYIYVRTLVRTYVRAYGTHTHTHTCVSKYINLD